MKDNLNHTVFDKKTHKSYRWPKKLMMALIALVSILLFIGMIPRIRTSVVMPIVSAVELKNASPVISFDIPNAESLAWLPHMLIYEDKGGYNTRFKASVHLTIYYAFGAFDSWSHARFYDENSPYYSAFYGGYVVENVGEDVSVHQKMIETIPAYDYQYLILKDLGCPEDMLFFEPKIVSVEENVEISGYLDWTRYDVQIDTRGSAHTRQGFVRHDLEFGTPPIPLEGDFSKISLLGRIYTRYDASLDTLLILYVIAPSEAVVSATDCESLLKTTIQVNK